MQRSRDGFELKPAARLELEILHITSYYCLVGVVKKEEKFKEKIP